MADERQLLRLYVEQSSEEAFREIVAHQIDLVYSAAFRLVNGDSHLAEDVVQTVFADLARKAKRLSRNVVLGGWLYRHTCFVAATMIRTERRRKIRELSAIEMSTLQENSQPIWLMLEPLLDEAMSQLKTCDRDAVVLRFFQKQDLRSIGAALGISEDAAQKRIARALEKLRATLSQKGVMPSAATLAAALADFSVAAAPAGLAAGVANASLCAVSAGSGIAAFAIKVMAMSKLKTGITAVLIVAGVATPVLLQRTSIVELRQENRLLRDQARQFTQRLEPGSQPDHDSDGLKNLREEHLELMRLRNEVGRLRRENAERRQRIESDSSNTAQWRTNSFGRLTDFTPSDQWSDAGAATPETAVETLLWTLRTGNSSRFLDLVQWQVFGAGVNIDNVGFDRETIEPRVVNSMRGFVQQMQGGRISDVERPSEYLAKIQLEMTDQTGQALSKTVYLARQEASWKVAITIRRDDSGQELLQELPLSTETNPH